MTMLNLEPFGLANVDITESMRYAVKLCEDNASYDKDCADILESLVKAASDSKYSAVAQEAYKMLAVRCCYYFMGVQW